jgi:hypothetical protein
MLGSVLSYKFHPSIRDECSCDCPPNSADQVQQTIYRGIRELPLKPEDFLSHAELNLVDDRTICEHWGLSVWVTLNAVKNDMKTYRPLRKWHVASGDVSPDDGVLMATPTRRQPEHYTFWKVYGKDISGSFTIIISPSNQT